VALCPLNNEIWIFDTQGSPDISKWTKVATLKEHFNVIMSLDWHPKTNLLLSASADRGIIVWKPQGDSFTPQIGMNQEKKAHLHATWNHRGDKFCVGSSSGHVYLAEFNENNNFWVAQPIKKKPVHKASVVCVRFDSQSGRVIASASLDGTV
jgi:WD40 repeat protein